MPQSSTVIVGLSAGLCAFSLSCASAVAATPAQNAQVNLFTYVYLNDGNTLVVNEGKEYVSLMDETDKATFCDKASGFYCVHSVGISFAVPRNLKPDQDRWTERGRTYRVVNKLTGTTLFGRELQFMVIMGGPSPTDIPAYYYYSPKNGLIGWLIEPDPASEPVMILSKDPVGFAKQ